MKRIDTTEYVSALRSLVEAGHEVNMTIAGNSMSPFLIHQRDIIWFRQPDRALQAGDMVFYQRDNGQYIMHRICRVHENIYDIIGDAQTEMETGVRRDQIFAVITKVQRKGTIIQPGDFWWEFFAHVWRHMIPLRQPIMRLYARK